MGEVEMNVERIAIGGKAVRILAQQDRIVGHIRSGKPFEPQSRRLWGEWCAGGGTVIDVGVYDGLFSIGAALHGCRVIGFEPMLFNYQRSLHNARLNDVTINCIHAAASDKNGRVELVYNPKVAFTAGASLVRRKGSRVEVETMAIDSLPAEQLTGLKAIKIDVERAEPLVLRGARATLERYRPKMLVEALGDAERAAVLAELPGYRLADVLDVRNLVMLPV